MRNTQTKLNIKIQRTRIYIDLQYVVDYQKKNGNKIV